MTRTLAYYGTHLIAAVKGFMIQAVADYCPKSKKKTKRQKENENVEFINIMQDDSTFYKLEFEVQM